MFDYDKLDEFTRAYIECAIWCDESTQEYNADETPEQTKYNPDLWDIENLSQSAADRMIADCKVFQYENRCYWVQVETVDDSQAGNDFWYTRNGHGVGFWDRPEKYGEAMAKYLTEKSKRWPEMYMFEYENELHVE